MEKDQTVFVVVYGDDTDIFVSNVFREHKEVKDKAIEIISNEVVGHYDLSEVYEEEGCSDFEEFIKTKLDSEDFEECFDKIRQALSYEGYRIDIVATRLNFS